MKDYRPLFSSLAVRLMALLALIVIAGSGLTLVSVTRITRRQFLSYVQESDRLRARELATGLASYYADRGDFRGVEELLQPALQSAQRPRGSETMMRRMHEMRSPAMPGMMPAMVPERIILVDHDARIVADTRPPGPDAGRGAFLPGARDRGEPVAVIAPSNTSTGAPTGAPNGTPGDEPAGWVLVGSMIDSTFNPLQEQFLGALRRGVLLSALAVGVMALVLGTLFLAGITRPLRDLTRAAGTITSGNLTVTIPPGGRGEVGALADSFRAMRASLEAANTLRERMFRNIAHELRTPVTLLRGEIEAMLDGIYTIDADSVRSLQEEIEILDRLVSDIRLISSMDSGDFLLKREPVDTGELLQRVGTAFRNEADAAGITIRTEISHPLPTVDADRARLMQVISNLIVNVLRHGETADSIVLSAAPKVPVTQAVPGAQSAPTTSSGVEITVRDNGRGIPAEHLGRVFERLYRVEKARSRAGGNDGAGGGGGLGLSIARQIVEAHGGRIVAESSGGSGTRIRIWLPGDPSNPGPHVPQTPP